MKRMIGFGILLGLFLVGCEKSVDPGNQGIPDETNGRITVTNDEVRLNARVTAKNENVPVDTTLRKTDKVVAFGLTYIAEISSPTVGGQKLQATSVVLKGDYAYASYNMIGNPAIGAMDIIQVKGVSSPVIRSHVTFTDVDVNNVYFDNNKVYLAEGPSAIEALSAVSGKLGLTGNTKRLLNSYVATSVFAAGGKVYVTTGNTGGLYVLTQNDSLSQESYTALSDARWIDADASYVVVAQGTPGRLSVFNKSTMALVNTFSVGGATVAESKSTVRLIGGKALFAAGDGGVKLVNLATGTTVGSIARMTVSGLDPSVTVTNAVDGSGLFVYSSNGEAGIYIALATQFLEDVTGNTSIMLFTLGRLQFPTQQSVNHIAFDGSTVAIAAGLGGVKLVNMTY